MTRYMGYPLQSQEVNLDVSAQALKERIFMAYAKHDGAVCQTTAECASTRTYGSYLLRQYFVTSESAALTGQVTGAATPQ